MNACRPRSGYEDLVKNQIHDNHSPSPAAGRWNGVVEEVRVIWTGSDFPTAPPSPGWPEPST
jgi:hypothetical protein